jgi:hypothetical protein
VNYRASPRLDRRAGIWGKWVGKARDRKATHTVPIRLAPQNRGSWKLHLTMN